MISANKIIERDEERIGEWGGDEVSGGSCSWGVESRRYIRTYRTYNNKFQNILRALFFGGAIAFAIAALEMGKKILDFPTNGKSIKLIKSMNISVKTDCVAILNGEGRVVSGVGICKNQKFLIDIKMKLTCSMNNISSHDILTIIFGEGREDAGVGILEKLVYFSNFAFNVKIKTLIKPKDAAASLAPKRDVIKPRSRDIHKVN